MIDLTMIERGHPDKYGDTGGKGKCICHQCNFTSEATDTPCNEKICPKCGARLGRASEWLIPFDRRMPY